VIYALALIAVCALAQGTMPSNMCSVNATGTVSYNGVSYNGTMIRVRDTVRYDFFSTETAQSCSVLVRPDVSKSFFFMDADPPSCSSSEGVVKLEDYVFQETTEDGLDIFVAGESKMVFFHENQTLYMEEISTDKGVVVFNYEYVDYTYVHEQDAAFSINDQGCPDAETDATLADSSIQCSPGEWFVPYLPGCAFKLHMVGVLRGMIQTVDMEILTENGTSGCVKAVIGPVYHVLRCDMMNDAGQCYIVTHIVSPQSGSDSSSSECAGIIDKEEYSFFSEEMPLAPFMYNGEGKSVTCPDGSDGCKQYCNREMSCNVVDEQSRIVIHNGLNITYVSGVPHIDDFTYVFCNGTVLEHPENPCGNESYSSSDSSSHSSGNYTSDPSSSSFSVPSVLVLAVVSVLLALF